MKKIDLEKLELRARSLDTIRVHNPTKEDYIIWNNRSQSNNEPAEKWVVPSATKDVGFGKGNMDMPAFAAERYVEDMMVVCINMQWEEEWTKLKNKYRRDEWERVEQRMTPKTNDPKLQAALLPTLWIGLVRKYEIPDDVLDVEPDEPVEAGIKGLLSTLKLDEKMIEQNKEDFLNDVVDE